MSAESSGSESNSTLFIISTLPEAMTEANGGLTFSPNMPASNIPLIVLGLESICGVICNGAVLLLFCIRPPLLRTASDLFTINLSLVDLIFSGIVLPVVLVTSFMAKSICNGDSEAARVVEVARSCIVLFGTVAAALGTLLVSLDRGDVTLKPSKRFFTHKRAVFGITLTWCISSLGLLIALLPTLLSLDKDDTVLHDANLTNVSKQVSSYLKSNTNNITSIKYLKSPQTCCRAYPCSSGNINACIFQLIFEIPIFIAAIATIIIIYGKILWSVQRRNRRYMKVSQKQRSRFGSNRSQSSTLKKSKFCKPNMCCMIRDATPCETTKPDMNQNSNANNGTAACRNGAENSQDTAQKSKSAKQYLTTAIDNKKSKKQDSLEDALFVPPASKSDINEAPAAKAVTNTAPKERTDFATVAMSVTVVLAIKRMAARKIKERKKKMRHLKKMTFLIIFTFLFCWSPYYFTKLAIVFTMQFGDGGRTSAKNSTNESSSENLLTEKICLPDWIFTWTLAVAALSCISNPALYMFSREKIRLEFMKTFFPHCAGRNTAKYRGKQPKYSLCLACWDAEDNFSGKGKNDTAASMFKTGWQNSQRHQNGREAKREENCGSFNSREDMHCLDCDNKDSASEKKSIKPPLLRWDVIPCDSSEGSCDKWDDAAEEHPDIAPNDGLLLAPTRQDRVGSFSGRSLDMISCSTTTASIIAEL